MTTDPFDFDNDTLPDDQVLIPGKLLTPTARAAKVPFRIASSKPVTVSGRRVPEGIVILKVDESRFHEAMAKAKERKIREAKYANPLTRH